VALYTRKNDDSFCNGVPDAIAVQEKRKPDLQRTEIPEATRKLLKADGPLMYWKVITEQESALYCDELTATYGDNAMERVLLPDFGLPVGLNCYYLEDGSRIDIERDSPTLESINSFRNID